MSYSTFLIAEASELTGRCTAEIQVFENKFLKALIDFI
jgi:hypothetical protein